MAENIKRKSGAEIIIDALIENRVDTVFGYPGGQVLHIFSELEKKRRKIKFIMTAHEQGAAHAADGYARTTGKVGVVIATSGPGASNLVTGIANAYLDSVSMVAITGNVSCDSIGKDSFQELDIADITMPITKHNYIVKDINNLNSILNEAFALASEGRCGPVLVDIPKDIQTAFTVCQDNKAKITPPRIPAEAQFERVKKIIDKSKRPFIYSGGGVISADAEDLLKELSSKIDAPIGCTLMGLGAVNSNFENMLGLIGIHGNIQAIKAMKNADVIIALGTRFSDRTIGINGELIGNAKIIQLDIDPAEINKNIQVEANLIGDLGFTLKKICEIVCPANHSKWKQEIAAYNTKKQTVPQDFCPEAIIKEISEYAKGVSIATDVGQHQLWCAKYCTITEKRSFLTSGGLGAMGFGMGAAIGASIAKGNAPVVLFTGDGSFGMNLNELATAVSYKLPIVVVIMNNSALGLVKQWQNLLFKRESYSSLARKTDFPKLAEAFGADGASVSNINELKSALKSAFKKGRTTPYVIDCKISNNHSVFHIDN